jgi:hypothetical protein
MMIDNEVEEYNDEEEVEYDHYTMMMVMVVMMVVMMMMMRMMRMRKWLQCVPLTGDGEVFRGDGLESRGGLDGLRAQHEGLAAAVEEAQQAREARDDLGGDRREAHGHVEVLQTRLREQQRAPTHFEVARRVHAHRLQIAIAWGCGLSRRSGGGRGRGGGGAVPASHEVL